MYKRLTSIPPSHPVEGATGEEGGVGCMQWTLKGIGMIARRGRGMRPGTRQMRPQIKYISREKR
jgi:hypothetical protein